MSCMSDDCACMHRIGKLILVKLKSPLNILRPATYITERKKRVNNVRCLIMLIDSTICDSVDRNLH